MKLISASASFLIGILTTPVWAGNYDAVAYTSLRDVLATPELFHQKKVMLTGWVTSIKDEYALCQTKVPDSSFECIWLDVASKDSIGLGDNKLLKRKKLMAKYKGQLLSLYATFDTENTGSLDQISGGLLAITHLRLH